MTGSGRDEEELVLPQLPGIGGALREALFDFYYNSWRFVPGNVIWGVLLLALLFAVAIWLPAIGLIGLLGLPVAGLHYMAARIARGEGTAFSEFFAGLRRHAGPAFGLGLLATVLAMVFTTNVLIGLEIGDLFGLVLSGFALYGNIGLAMFLVAAWPLLVDPLREGMPVRRRLWLAAVVNLARPGRMFALTAVIGILVVISVFLFAALITISIAYISLVGTRYVLPVADRLEGRATVPRNDE